MNGLYRFGDSDYGSGFCVVGEGDWRLGTVRWVLIWVLEVKG